MRLLLRALERISIARERDTTDGYLPFAELTMAVILGVAIEQTASAINHEFSIDNYRAILLVTALLLFVEMYVVLTRYHRWLRLPYANLYIFIDLFIALPFVSFVLLVGDSWADPERVDSALAVLAFLFVAQFFRQVVTFVDLVLQSTDFDSAIKHLTPEDRLKAINIDLILRNKNVRARLREVDFTEYGLYIPMGADLFGVIFAILGRAVFDITWWCVVGLAVILLYEVVMFVIVFRGTPGRETRRVPQTATDVEVEEREASIL